MHLPTSLFTFLKPSPIYPFNPPAAFTAPKIMPKASKSKTSARINPLAKPEKNTKGFEDLEVLQASRGRVRPRKHAKGGEGKDNDTTTTTKPNPSKPKDPKASHLYTDDNPSTTLHGTGFKDANTAKHTLDLIAKRSLTYQSQTVNTMYHRAKHHPAMKNGDTAKNADMREAVEVSGSGSRSLGRLQRRV